MSRMPGTVWQGEQSPPASMDRYDIVCIHTIVGYAPAHAAHFSTKADGTIIQSRDTAYRSAANLDGNHRVIAIENEDHGPRFGGTPRLPGWVPLTPEQIQACASILAWAHTEHGVPLQLCPDSRPTSRGLAYHRQGIDGNFGSYRFPGRVTGGETWTESFGKVCPTDVRIAQLPDILAAARALIEGDDMADYAKQLDEIQADAKAARAAAEKASASLMQQSVRERARFKRVMVRLAKIRDQAKDDATKADIQQLADELAADD